MIAEMKKIMIAIPRSLREDVLQFLQEETAIHLIEASSQNAKEQEQASESAYYIAELTSALDFIEYLRRELGIKRKRDLKNIFAGKDAASLAELEETAKELNVPSLIATVQRLRDGITAVDSRMMEIGGTLDAMLPWKNLSITGIDISRDNGSARHALISLTTSDEQTFQEALFQIPSALWQETYRVEMKKSMAIFGELIFHSSDQALVDELIDTTEAVRITLALEDTATVRGAYEALETQQKVLGKQRNALLAEARSLISLEQSIKFAYDALLHRGERDRAADAAHNLLFTTTLSGWIPASWVAPFTDRIAERFPSAALETASPREEDRAPVLFQNSRMVKPFETVTDLYGKPAYHELDPTGPLSIFFLISFGLALTDAGYGIILMIGSFLAERFLRLKRDSQKMARLMFYGGVATLVLGALTGGWFGIVLETLPDSALKSILLSAKLLDPLAQPILLLGIIFAFGVVQLLYAFIVRGMHHWKQNEKSIAIMDDFSWVFLVVFIMASLASSQGYLLSGYAPAFKWIMYAGLLFMVATQGRSMSNIFLKAGSGVMSLYGLIAFVSDILSYSRLLALGLATGIIGLVVNLIASMVQSSIPVAGVVLAGAVLLVGHVFNLGINALGAFIHSGRLQFVEFFPKFMEGGGVAFRPFGRVGKYVDNPKDFIKVV